MTNVLPLLASLFVLWQVDPYADMKRLPDAEPTDGKETRVLAVASARGETTGLSFVIRADAALPQVDFRITELKGPGGATIPASAIDLHAVKCLYRPKGQWLDPACGDRKTPELMNQILLHDDALVRVDERTKVNCLRIEGPDGAYYADMGADGCKEAFNCSLQPVGDAPAFVPTDVGSGRCRQFFAVCRTPSDAKGGDYRGRIEVVSDGRVRDTLDVAWTVRPFALPRARTHYDTSREYMLGVYHHCHLRELLDQGGDLAQAERKFRAIARSWREHNVLFPLDQGGVLDGKSTECRELAILRQEGLPCRPLLHGQAGDFQWACPPGVTEKPDPKKDPEGYAKSLGAFREKVARECATMDRLLGHHDCYYLAPDECGSETNRRLFDYWRILHEFGCSVYTDSGKDPDIAWMNDANNEPALIDHRTAWRWHAAGSRCFTYAAPFMGPVCPDIWRRTKGLRVWFADYDGVIDYNFNEGPNRWNEFINHTNSGYNQFGIVFETLDGLVSTLAYEALREGLNDVRYCSLLRLRAEKAMASSDEKIRTLGRQALVWQDATDPEEVVDLDDYRAKVSAWIVRLQDAVGGEIADFAEGPVPELPPDPRSPSAARRDLQIAACSAVRADVAKPSSDRVRAAVREASLLSDLLRRGEAVAVLDGLLAETGHKGDDIALLQLEKAKVLATPAAFAEKATEARLKAAAAALTAALQRGVPAKERLETIMRLGRAHLDAGFWKGAVDLVLPLVRIKGLPSLDQAALHAIAGRALRAQGDREGAVRELRLAAKLRKGPGEISLFCLEPLAELAEETQDWPLALDAYTELKGCYHPEYDTERAMVRFYENKIKQTMPKIRKTAAPAKADFDDDGGGISLDE